MRDLLADRWGIQACWWCYKRATLTETERDERHPQAQHIDEHFRDDEMIPQFRRRLRRRFSGTPRASLTTSPYRWLGTSSKLLSVQVDPFLLPVRMPF